MRQASGSLLRKRAFVVVLIVFFVNYASYSFSHSSSIAPVTGGPEVVEQAVQQCNDFQPPSNASLYSSPDFLSEYLAHAPCLGPPLQRLSSRLGPHGEILITADYTYRAARRQGRGLCEDQGRGVSVVYVVLSRGGPGARARTRRLGVLGGPATAFLVMRQGGQAGAALETEQEEHGDIILTNVDDGDEFASIHLTLSALYLAVTQCSMVRYLALVQEDVFINKEIIERFAGVESIAANRMYGDLLRDYGPARDPASPRHLATAAWPWPRFPPFLGPALLLLSADTLPRLLLAAPALPPLALPEVWLTGLVGLHASILRVGVRDFFAPVRRKAPACYWPNYAVVSGVSGPAEEALLAARLTSEATRGCKDNATTSERPK